MPLIVLLEDVFHRFARSVKRLEHWNELVELEALLVARARSAFLVHWFGSSIPLDGSSVRIGIVNLEALRQRYSLVMSKRRSGLSDGPSALEPMAGIAGSVAGAALAPTNFMMILATAEPFLSKNIDSKIKRILFQIGVAINWLTCGVLGPVVAVAVAAFGPVFILGYVGVPGTAEVQDFLTAATRLAKPLQEFWRQASGPRDQVKNPIVRASLDILDKLAVLFPFFMETVAFLIGKVGPLLDPLLHQFQALGAYLTAVFQLAEFAATEMYGLLKQWLDPKRSGSLPHQLALAFDALGGLFQFLADGIRLLLIDEVSDDFKSFGQGLSDYYSEVVARVGKRIKDIFAENPLVAAVRALLERVDQLTPFFSRLLADDKPEKEEKDDPSRIGDAFKFQFQDVRGDIAWLKNKSNRPSLDFQIPLKDLLSQHHLDPFPELTAHFHAAAGPFPDVTAKFARRPPSVFSQERKALDQFAKDQFDMPTIERAVAAVHIDETRLREALLAVASKVLPAAIQPYLKTLSDSMEMAETALRQEPLAADAPTFPVLELPEDQKLRPVIGKLVVRVRGAARELAGEWTEGLKETLRSQVYPMPSEKGATG